MYIFPRNKSCRCPRRLSFFASRHSIRTRFRDDDTLRVSLTTSNTNIANGIRENKVLRPFRLCTLHGGSSRKLDSKEFSRDEQNASGENRSVRPTSRMIKVPVGASSRAARAINTNVETAGEETRRHIASSSHILCEIALGRVFLSLRSSEETRTSGMQLTAERAHPSRDGIRFKILILSSSFSASSNATRILIEF